MGNRADESTGGHGEPVRVARRLRDRVLLTADRLVVAGAVVGAVLVTLVGLDRFGVVRFAGGRPTLTLLGSLVGGNLTLITVVASINQLVLSRELKAPEDLRDQMAAVDDYRGELRSFADGVVPPVTPSPFLAFVVDVLRRHSRELRALAGTATDEEVRAAVDRLARTLAVQMDRLDAIVGEESTSWFRALAAMLATNYSTEIRTIEQLRHERSEDVPARLDGALDELGRGLKHLDVARQYFKTVYVQQELAKLSRLLLYAGLPAELLLVVVMGRFVAESGATPVPPVVVAATVAVGFAPLAILAAFILRVAVVAERTAAITPFTSPEQELLR